MKYYTIFIAAFLFNICSISAATNIESGDICTYETRAGEDTSRIIILKVENNIVHISIESVSIKNPESNTGISERISHLPFYRKFLIKSKIKCSEKTDEIPTFSRGYKKWLKAKAKGTASPFRMPIKDALDMIEKMLSKQK